MLTLPPEYESFQALAEEAFAEWAPNASVKFLPLKPGLSGSVLLRADLRTDDISGIKSGQYILKLSQPLKWADQEDEIIAHQRAYKWNESYSQHHLPVLIEDYTSKSGLGFAMLLEIAGRSLDRYVTTDGRENNSFLEISDKLIADILNYWCLPNPKVDRKPDEILSILSGYRLNPAEASQLYQYVNETIGDEIYFLVSGEVLLNPLKFFEFAKQQQWEASPTIETLLHGDLHGGNIMVNRMSPQDQPYWLIDFAMSKQGPVGYDEAYIELGHSLLSIGDDSPEVLIGALRSVEYPRDRTSLPNGALWTSTLLKKMRRAISTWRDVTHSQRLDEIDRQFSLCRVAAGINWANKLLKGRRRHLALCYAGWAAREYVKVHQPADWAKLWQRPTMREIARADAGASADEKLWNELWEAVGGFSVRHGRYMLIAECLGDFDELRALGQLPWSAVIDLDPKSDTIGLHRHASPILSARRGLHTFSSALPVSDASRGTSWMMAAGWALKSEHFPDYNEWKYARLQGIRNFVKTLEDSVRPDALHVVVLPGTSLDPTTPMARLGSVISAVDEATQGRAQIYLLGRRRVPERVSKLSHFPIDSVRFVNFVAKTFGTQFVDNVAQVPGPDGQGRTIPLDLLRAMQENFHVLHSSVLEESTDQNYEHDAFWRGRPPNWSELNNGIDIVRNIHGNLSETLIEKLDSYRSQTVVLPHTPGAGGTTAALRAAWDLRTRYPTAILHRYSPALKDRTRDLFHVAERPVLLLAESADLTETAREELYRYLAHENCRVVLLYIRRVFSPVPANPNFLTDPMDKAEARRFYDTYASLTQNAERLKQLELITAGQGSFESYRVPFFYGLITFERNFLGVEKYVSRHLNQARRAARDMLEYLALVTIFSNSGIGETLLKAMMGISPQSKLTLSEILGDAPARLVIARPGGFRLMHQVIAEQVLTYFRGGESDHWTYELATYATDFIRDAVEAAGAESETLLNLFRQMFVDRSTGTTVGTEDRGEFAPIIEALDSIDNTLGHNVLEALTKFCPDEPHFWTHLGRHQIYRLKRDYVRAEEYLTRAVNLSPEDAIHHHAYGLVLRSRLGQSVRTAARSKSLAAIFGSIEPYFSKAAHEFDETLRIDPENIYGHITHAQMILEVARFLKDAAGVDTIALVGSDQREIRDWLHEHVPFAEELLRGASALYGTLDQSNTFLTDCHAQLGRLYGDLDRVVRLWEIANESGTDSSTGRRALANAYLARSDRKWSGLDQAELRRIVTLMESNLRHASRRDDDYRFWFEAYKLLPDFDVNVALSQLALWIKRFPSWWAHYYMYVLHYMLWFKGRSDSMVEFQEALEQCQKLHIGRKNASSLWYGKSGNDSFLVSEHDLGSWSRKIDFWSSPGLLLRVNGVIEETIHGPQAGYIRIDGRIRVFFVPGKHFSPHKDENKPVNFYLGFSAAGLRAWSVEHGHVEGDDRSKRPTTQAATLETPFIQAPAVTDESKLQRVKKLKLDRVMQFADELIRAKANIGVEITITELADRVDAVFGIKSTLNALGVDDWMAELGKTDAYILRENGTETIVSPVLPADNRSKNEEITAGENLIGQVTRYDASGWGFIKSQDGKQYWFHRNSALPNNRQRLKYPNHIVLFKVGQAEKGPIAVGVRIIDDTSLGPSGLLKNSDLASYLAEFIESELEKSSREGIPLGALSKRLIEEYKGYGPLASRLGAKSLISFIEGIGGVTVRGQKVHLVRSPEFGRLPPVQVPKPAIEKTREKKAVATKAAAREIEAVMEAAIQLVKQGNLKGEPLQVKTVGQNLAVAFPGDRKLASRLGCRSLGDFLNEIPGMTIIGREPNRIIEFVRPGAPVTLEDVKRDILRLVRVAEKAGSSMDISTLGDALSKIYEGPEKINKRLVPTIPKW